MGLFSKKDRPELADWEREGEDAAWGGRGPSASYQEWLAEGRVEDPAPEKP